MGMWSVVPSGKESACATGAEVEDDAMAREEGGEVVDVETDVVDSRCSLSSMRAEQPRELLCCWIPSRSEGGRGRKRCAGKFGLYGYSRLAKSRDGCEAGGRVWVGVWCQARKGGGREGEMQGSTRGREPGSYFASGQASAGRGRTTKYPSVPRNVRPPRFFWNRPSTPRETRSPLHPLGMGDAGSRENIANDTRSTGRGDAPAERDAINRHTHAGSSGHSHSWCCHPRPREACATGDCAWEKCRPLRRPAQNIRVWMPARCPGQKC